MTTTPPQGEDHIPPAYIPPPATPPPTPPQMQPGQPPASERTNTLAIVAFVSSFFVSILGIVLGHISLNQIKKSGEQGRGFALAGTIIGYVSTGIFVFVIGSMLLMMSLGIGQLFMISQAFKDDPPSGYTYEYEHEYGYDDFDDEWGEGSDSEYEYEGPWVGTPNEEFCEAYMSHEVDLSPEHYRELADLAPDADLSQQLNKLADMLAGDSDLSFEEGRELTEHSSDTAFDLCYP